MSPLAWLNPGRWLLYIALAGALVVGYFAWADHIGDKREAQVVARYAKQAADADAQRAAISAPIVAKEATSQARIKTVYQTITKEIPIYVKADDCPLSGGFRLLHDAAANGKVPDASRLPDAASVPAQTAASTIAENYGTCKQTSQRLTSLQEWVRAQDQAK